MELNTITVPLCAAILVSGCATVVRGTEQQVSINTQPIGATLQFSNGQSCTSPCTITVPPSQALSIQIMREGCQTQTASMIPTLGGAGVVLGSLVDYGTGAVYDLQPNPLTVTLACCDSGGRVSGTFPITFQLGTTG
jgi:uncharacterized protein YceK